MLFDQSALLKLARLHREIAEVLEGQAMQKDRPSRVLPREERIMSLRAEVSAAIADRPGSTTLELTEAIWPAHKHLEKAELKRRITVMVSAMFKKEGSVIKGGVGREAKWYPKNLEPTLGNEGIDQNLGDTVS